MALPEIGDFGLLIDTVTNLFDSGFGLLKPDVLFLSTALITINIVLGFLFLALAVDVDIPTTLARKVIYVGFFAYIIDKFPILSQAIFDSFARLGSKAGGNTSLTVEQLTNPTFIVKKGFDVGWQMIEVSGKVGWAYLTDISGLIVALVIFFCAIVVMYVFFRLAIELFVAVIAFKLVTLVGFVLIPFGLFGQTSFLADRVITTIFNHGVRVMLLTILVGVGVSFFSSLEVPKSTPTFENAVTIALIAFTILMLVYHISTIARDLIMGHANFDGGAVSYTGSRIMQYTGANYGAYKLRQGLQAGWRRMTDRGSHGANE